MGSAVISSARYLASECSEYSHVGNQKLESDPLCYLKNDSQISRWQCSKLLGRLWKCLSWGIICGYFHLIVIFFKSHNFDWHNLHSSFVQELLVQMIWMTLEMWQDTIVGYIMVSFFEWSNWMRMRGFDIGGHAYLIRWAVVVVGMASRGHFYLWCALAAGWLLMYM